MRIGIIKVSPNILSDPAAFSHLFKDMVVLNVENNYMENRMIYTLYCKSFRDIDKGEVTPEYVFSFNGMETVKEIPYK